ncbi:unnamed protein product, partial [Schistosoma turkestanicum]
SSDLVHRVRNLIKTAPNDLSPSTSPNHQTSSMISKLCASPPKRLMKMLSRRHEDLSHITSFCDCTSLHFGMNSESQHDLFNNNTDTTILMDKTDPPELISGWEGPAILRHGSVIQFGCYKFVFGLVNHSLPPYSPSPPPPSSASALMMTTTSTKSTTTVTTPHSSIAIS